MGVNQAQAKTITREEDSEGRVSIDTVKPKSGTMGAEVIYPKYTTEDDVVKADGRQTQSNESTEGNLWPTRMRSRHEGKAELGRCSQMKPNTDPERMAKRGPQKMSEVGKNQDSLDMTKKWQAPDLMTINLSCQVLHSPPKQSMI